jgi:diguanylate cyclase (GGDEF)-like protein/PAS domain S-box-containing protein
MLDNDMVGMVRLKDRHAVWKNRALDAIFGYEPGELQGAPSRLLYLDEESYEAVGRAGYKALKAGRRYRTQLRMRHKDGHPIWIDLSGAAVSGDTSLWMLSDITALKLNEERAHHLARHDTLTGLPNRLQFIDHLTFALSDSARTGGTVAVCFLDLDGFKGINDRLGHDAGDAVLRAVAKRLTSAVRTDDLVARLGGDEFTIALWNIHELGELHAILESLVNEVEQPIELFGDYEVCVGASIGLAISPIHGTTAADLMKAADEEMYARKRARRLKIDPAGAEPTSAAATKHLQLT